MVSWRRSELNRQPHVCQTCALPIELHPHVEKVLDSNQRLLRHIPRKCVASALPIELYLLRSDSDVLDVELPPLSVDLGIRRDGGSASRTTPSDSYVRPLRVRSNTVEVRGFGPLALCLQSRRSTGLSYTPKQVRALACPHLRCPGFPGALTQEASTRGQQGSHVEKVGVEPTAFRVRGGRSTMAELHPLRLLSFWDLNPGPSRCDRDALPG